MLKEKDGFPFSGFPLFFICLPMAITILHYNRRMLISISIRTHIVEVTVREAFDSTKVMCN